MENWKSLFRPHILQRGLDYYEEGAVVSFDKTESGYRAEVEGTEDYEVEIEIQDGEITDLYCSCPYADDGNCCKHMAAVLYAVDNGEPSETGAQNPSDMRNERISGLQKIVADIPEKELRELVVSLADNDQSLHNRLMLQYGNVNLAFLARLKTQIDEIGWRYSDRSGFIDYRNAYDYCSVLEAVLDDNVPTLIERGYIKGAFELTNYVFMEIAEREIDDSDGGTSEVASLCYEYWKQIVCAADEAEEKEMIQWFKKRRYRHIPDYMEEYIQEFLLDEFYDEELLRENLEYLDESIKKLEHSTDESNWSREQECANCVLKRIALMEKLHYSQGDIREYRDRYRRFPEIRKMEICEYREKQDYDAAISVLKESKEMDGRFAGQVSGYSEDLLELYEMTGQQEAYREELIWHVYHCSQNNLIYILKLKDLCTEAEWERERERLLASKSTWGVHYKLLENEKMYEQLLKEIKEHPGIYLMDQYEGVLKKYFPEEVRDIYADYVERWAERTSDRKSYQGQVMYLKKIAKYPGGRELAGKIAAGWKLKYRRRPAMMDELRKAGF